MKTSIALLIFAALISCKKEIIKKDYNQIAVVLQPPVITPPVVKDIPNNIVYQTTLGGVISVTYTDSSKATIKPDKFSLSKSIVYLTKNGKTDTLYQTEATLNGIKTIQCFTVKNELYMSFQVNSSGQAGNGVFYDIYPFKNIDPLGKLSYMACMQKLIKDCMQGWGCRIVCGLAAAPCTTGWSLNCFALKFH